MEPAAWLIVVSRVALIVPSAISEFTPVKNCARNSDCSIGYELWNAMPWRVSHQSTVMYEITATVAGVISPDVLMLTG